MSNENEEGDPFVEPDVPMPNQFISTFTWNKPDIFFRWQRDTEIESFYDIGPEFSQTAELPFFSNNFYGHPFIKKTSSESLDYHDGSESLNCYDGSESLDDPCPHQICRWSVSDHDGYKSLDDHDGSKIFEGCGQFEPDKSNLGDYQTNVDGISGETSTREDNSGEIYSQIGQEVVQNHQCQKKNEVKSVLESAVTTATVKTLGRIPKNCTKKGKHGRNIKDNIIRKIKVHYIKYIIKRLNKCIKNKKFKFLLINSSISELLTRSFNIRLFKMTIRKILYKTNISFNYKGHGKTLQVNRDVINYIYEYKEDEMEAYNILKKKISK